MGLFKLDPYGECRTLGGERLSEVIEPQVPRQRVAIPHDDGDLMFQGPVFRVFGETALRVEGIGVWDRQLGGTCLHVTAMNPVVLFPGDSLNPSLVLRDTGHPVFNIRGSLRHLGLL